MRDPRLEELARNLVSYSVRVQPGENVLIHAVGHTPELVQAIIREVYLAKGNPFVQLVDPKIKRELAKECTEQQLTLLAEHETALMKQMDCYIGIRAGDNINEMADVLTDRMSMYRVFTSCLSWMSGCLRQNGWCCAIRIRPWRNWRT